jgi:outer membrane protein assembly factor BamB
MALPAPPAIVLLAVLLCALLAGPLASAAHAEPAWTTYHRDPGRSGDDPETLGPSAPSFAWQSPDLGAPIWGQPLVLGARVYVATVGDMVYSLEASTGKVAWQKSLGTPVPASALPCGDISPTVGIVGTPVIDPSTNVLYAVADTWNAGKEEAHHLLEALSLANGEEVLSVPVDPPGADPKALLQRTALNLDNGRIVFGFGGNDGDCGEYRGAVVSAPASGGQARFWQVPIAAPASTGGAVWGPSGPAVDGSGEIYASTGNPNPDGGPAETFDYSDGLVELDPAHDFVADPAHEAATPLGFFEPPSWAKDSNEDADLGSAGPELLPGGVLFQAGKNGTGYLVDEATMQAGAPAVYSGEVCASAGSFGGDAYAQGVIYLACTNGVQALSYDQATRTFTPLWQGPADAFGPPIVSAGLVWSLATGGFHGGGTKLYGLDPASGEPRYTETLPRPIADHFASPSAAGGRLFVATGTSVSAFQLTPLSTSGDGAPGGGATGAGTSARAGAPTTTAAPATPRLTAGLATAIAILVHRRLQASRAGDVHIVLRCPPRARVRGGTIFLRTEVRTLAGRDGHPRPRLVTIPVAHRRFGPWRGTIRLTLHLGRFARRLLARHGGRLALEVSIAVPGHADTRVAAVLSAQ